ncbi:MAG: ABC transporter substrate-binding protein [Desulfotomaculaceae bacterium]|nr:ABC transporter substrate-binding protein [Desulfotomaculaceae bacterium]MDD4766826.1 ABC transporter substrate-binding protein [Desulfotomaculaceae bacterium]
MKKYRKVLTVLLLVSFLALVTTGCGGGDSSDTVKVGIILPLTGPEAMFGEMEKNSFDLAYEELKAAGKTSIGGKEIVLMYEDDQGKQDVAKSATEKLINKDQVAMLSGGYSSACTNVIAQSAQSMQKPFLIATGSSDDITRQGWSYVFRGTAAPASKYTGAFWDMMEKVVKPQNVAIIFENTDFGISSSKGFREECQKRGINVVFDQAYEHGAIDFKPMLANLRSTNPDMIFATSYVMDASMIINQMKELNFNTKLFVGNGAGYTMPEFYENAGAASDYVASTSLWVPSVTWSGADEYYNKYKQKYGKEPDYHGAQAYTTMYIIADALGRATDLTSPGIQKAMKETDFNSIMGPIKFEDWEGFTNQNKPITYVVQWDKGKLEVVWPEDVKSASYVYPVPNWNER